MRWAVREQIKTQKWPCNIRSYRNMELLSSKLGIYRLVVVQRSKVYHQKWCVYCWAFLPSHSFKRRVNLMIRRVTCDCLKMNQSSSHILYSEIAEDISKCSLYCLNSIKADAAWLLLGIALLFLKTALELKDLLSCASRDQISTSSLDICSRLASKMIILFICVYGPKLNLSSSMSVAGRRFALSET